MRWRRIVLAGAVAVLAGFAAGHAQAAPGIRLVPVVTAGLESPLFATHADDGSGRLFIVERAGRIRILANSALASGSFLDIVDRVLAGGERGLLGLAFHPQFESNGRFFVNYTSRPDGATRVSEFAVSADPGLASTTERVLLEVPQPYANHNGGWIGFGRDGFLYIAMGDGGSGGDPENRAQDTQELLGKILRIDVDQGDAYGIPADNPFAGGGGGAEIYALGFRNPWRLSFDRQSGRLHAGDVGQAGIEEIDLVKRGANYGWRIMEGNRCYDPSRNCNRRGLTAPIATYKHAKGRCSVTGGYVYRGRGIPALAGTYLYGDFCSGEIFGLRNGKSSVLLDTTLSIASFAEDEAGELLVVDLGGGIHRITKRQR